MFVCSVGSFMAVFFFPFVPHKQHEHLIQTLVVFLFVGLQRLDSFFDKLPSEGTTSVAEMCFGKLNQVILLFYLFFLLLFVRALLLA